MMGMRVSHQGVVVSDERGREIGVRGEVYAERQPHWHALEPKSSKESMSVRLAYKARNESGANVHRRLPNPCLR